MTDTHHNPHHAYNAFISYAWDDNQSFEKGNEGWVSVLVDKLNKHLNRELPRALPRNRIWLDYEQLRGNEAITPAIAKRLGESRLLVPILSRRWLDSPWCQEELQIFLRLHGPDSARIFPVWMEPVAELPAPLGELLKYQFWYQDDKKQLRTRSFPQYNPTDHDYINKLQDLARDMAERLRNLAEAEPPDTPGSAPRPAAPVRVEGEHRVFIDGGEDDWELIETVARRLLENHGIDYFLPLRQDSGLKSSEIGRNRRNKLDICNNVLLIYQNGPKHQVDQQLVDTLRATSRRPKSAPPLAIQLCHSHGSESLGFGISGMKIFPCGDPHLEDCARQLAEALKQEAQP